MDNPDKTDELISKFFAGEATPEEAMQLEDWKGQSPEHAALFAQSEKLFALAGKKSNELKLNKAAAWKKVEQTISKEAKIIPVKGKFKATLSIAAAMLVLCVAYFFIQKQGGEPAVQQILVSAKNENKNVNFNEQTRIELKAGSALVYDENFGKSNRNIKLHGSAYFTVTHSELLPFIVDLGQVYVKDLGTKFNITLSADTDSIHINVDEGVVLLFDSMSNSIEIKASERAIYIKSSKQIIQPEKQPAGSTVNFDKAPLSTVIAQLEEKFLTKIILDNPKLSTCIISAKFNNEDLATILAVIAETLGLTIEKQENNFIIKGQACN